VRRLIQEGWMDWGFNSSEQWKGILKAFLSGRGMLLMGRAGTGKTYTLQKIVENLPGCAYARIAPTNKAALLIQG
jgi:predicted ATPase with chaperone activity